MTQCPKCKKRPRYEPGGLCRSCQLAYNIAYRKAHPNRTQPDLSDLALSRMADKNRPKESVNG